MNTNQINDPDFFNRNFFNRTATQPAQAELSSLAKVVDKMETQRVDALRLCGEILATIEVNDKRGLFDKLTSAELYQLRQLVESWRKQFARIEVSPFL